MQKSVNMRNALWHVEELHFLCPTCQAAEKFEEVQLAYRILKDPGQRKDYDDLSTGGMGARFVEFKV